MYAKDGGLPPNFAKATVRIAVLDKNDNAPAFGRQYYALEVPENLGPVELFTLRATDQDTGASGEVDYRITGEIPSDTAGLEPISAVQSHQSSVLYFNAKLKAKGNFWFSSETLFSDFYMFALRKMKLSL